MAADIGVGGHSSAIFFIELPSRPRKKHPLRSFARLSLSKLPSELWTLIVEVDEGIFLVPQSEGNS
jgi:hypothetical protein